MVIYEVKGEYKRQCGREDGRYRGAFVCLHISVLYIA